MWMHITVSVQPSLAPLHSRFAVDLPVDISLLFSPASLPVWPWCISATSVTTNRCKRRSNVLRGSAHGSFSMENLHRRWNWRQQTEVTICLQVSQHTCRVWLQSAELGSWGEMLCHWEVPICCIKSRKGHSVLSDGVPVLNCWTGNMSQPLRLSYQSWLVAAQKFLPILAIYLETSHWENNNFAACQV